MSETGISRIENRAHHALTRQLGSGIALAAAVAILAQLLVVLTVWLFGLDGAVEAARQIAETESPARLLIEGLIVAPLLETFLMGWLILLMLDLGAHRFIVVLGSAVLWAWGHQLIRPLGWLTVFAFIGFSYLFIERNRKSGDGYMVAALCHFFANVISIAADLGTRPHL